MKEDNVRDILENTATVLKEVKSEREPEKGENINHTKAQMENLILKIHNSQISIEQGSKHILGEIQVERERMFHNLGNNLN